jgi:hypothetical protein
MIEFLAYDSCERIVHGMVDLRGDRIADLLVQPDRSIRAEQARTLGLRDGSMAGLPTRQLDLDQMSVVVATGPRGDQYRRVETISTPVSVHVGPYVVCGYLHVPAPMRPVLDRDLRPWFAVTEATIDYGCAGRAVRERHDTVLVNRAHVQAIIPIDPRMHEARWLASRPPAGLSDLPAAVGA